MKYIKRMAGFTLIELMIAVAIIALLAGIALPAYQDHVRRTRLQQAFADLSDFRVRLEHFYQSNNNYGDVTPGRGCGFVGAVQQMTFPSAGGFDYACVLTGGAAQAYTLTATGTGNVAGHVYTLDNTNQRRTVTFRGANVPNRACWLSRGNEC